MTHEEFRLEETRQKRAHWQRWGPYVSERAWGTVREDYSSYGTAWEYLSHDHARSRAYRWNEDGMAGICDRSASLRAYLPAATRTLVDVQPRGTDEGPVLLTSIVLEQMRPRR